MIKAERNAQADAMLAKLTDQQLADGLSRGLAKLAIVQGDRELFLDDVHDNIGHPSNHTSKQFVAAMESESDWMERHLRSAISDVRAEIKRRAQQQDNLAMTPAPQGDL